MNLYHYCANTALISIIANKEIWTSELSFSNDLLEGKWIREVFSQCCNDRDVLASEQNELLKNLDALSTIYGAAGFCMSEEGDLLSQWRAYAENAAGVAIGFHREYFEILGNLRRDRGDAFSAHLLKIEYDVVEQKKLLAEHLDEILKFVAEGVLRPSTILTYSEDKEKKRLQGYAAMSLRFLFLFGHIYKMKNPAFVEEREWRVISHLIREPSDSKFEQASKMEFRALPDRIIPFARIPLEPVPQTAIAEIILGPRNATPVEVVQALLVKHGWNGITVRKSKASYR